MAVLITRIEDLAHDWFSLGVIAGMHAAANDVGGRVEISGTRETRPHALAQRLTETRPDALAFLSCSPEYLALLNVSHSLGFPTILANTAFVRPGTSSVVCEDNAQGTRLSVDHLVDHGHERIGLVLNRWPEPWVFERHQSFEQSLADRGCDPMACPAGWIDVGYDIEGASPALEEQDRQCADRLLAYIERVKPTAIVAGAQTVSRAFGRLVAEGRLSVPGDVSVVCFDQHPSNATWYGTQPTTIELPLNAIGRQLFDVAEQLRRDFNPDYDPASNAGPHGIIQRRLPCTLKPGNTVETRA
ncbi:MAG: substrate-binding domain-containing protein [Planctomycetota bacterium]